MQAMTERYKAISVPRAIPNRSALRDIHFSLQILSDRRRFGGVLAGQQVLNIKIMAHKSHTQALAAAETLCADKGERLTPVRRRVLELLLEADAPVKAYDLLDMLKPGPGAAMPPTVYRALDFLMGLGLAHKIEALNAYVSCAHSHDGGGAELFICTQCHVVEERHGASHSSCAPDGFVIQRSVVEHFGLCAACTS